MLLLKDHFSSEGRIIMDYRAKLLNEITENDIQLLGQIRVTDEEYKALIAYGRDAVEYATNLSNPKHDLLLSMLMVQVAIFYYQEGNYWKYFEKEVGISVSAPKQTYLGKVFVKTIEFYKLLRLEKQYSQEQYVENIKAHAFVTNSYMGGFFEFASAFHENNLLRNLPSSPEDMIDIVEGLSDYMKDTMSSNGDSVKSGSTKASKSYKLLKATRRVFAQCDPATISNIFYPVLKTIDDDLFDQKLPIENLNRFDSAYIDWKHDRENHITNQAQRDEKLTRGTYSKKPYLKIEPNTELTILVVPAQTFRKSDVDIEEAALAVTINDHTEVRNLELRDSFGIYISEPIKMPIPSAFDEVSIRFIKAGGKAYKIKNRDYRLLNDKWQTIEKLSVGQNNIIIRNGTDIYWNENCEIIEHTTDYVNWEFFSVIIDKDSACRIGGRTISVAGEYSRTPVFEEEIEDFEVLDYQKTRITATKKHPVISFEVDESLWKGTFITINDSVFPVKDIQNEDIVVFSENGKCAVSIDINDLISYKEENYYSIDIDIPTIGRRHICDYVILRKFGCYLNYRYYVFKDSARLKVTSPIHEVSGDPNWEIEESSINETVFLIPLNPEMEYLDLDLYLNGDSNRELYIRKPINVFSYGFTEDQKIFQRTGDFYIWHNELTDNLYVRIKETSQVYAFYFEKEDAELYPGVLVKPGVFRIDISGIRRQMEEKFEYKWHHIILLFDTKSGNGTKLGDILYKNIIFPNPLGNIRVIGDSVGVIIEEIKGKADSLLTVVDSKTKDTVLNEYPLHEGDNIFDSVNPSKDYDYILLSSESDDFGWFSDIREVGRKECVRAVDYSDLSNTSIKIKEIKVGGKKIALGREYFIKINEKMPQGFYKAWMTGYERDEQGKRTNPDYIREIIFAVIKEGDYCTAKIAGKKSGKDWGPLYYDFWRKSLIGADFAFSRDVTDTDRFTRLDLDITDYIFRSSSIRKNTR